jgi:DNA recombination protein RmuC
VQIEFFIIGVLIVLGFILILFFVNKKLSELSDNSKPSEELLSIIKMLQEGSSADRRVLMDSLTKNTDSLNERLAQVQKNIGEMSEIGRGMKDLQELLRSPKLRGNVGEHILKELLGQMLPKQSFNLQYSFKSGTIVDAAIKTTGGIIPVDSKFPMENFRKMMVAKNDEEKQISEKDFVKDVKKHIDDISQKYILTDEGTIDYALMYIPSEAVYYEIVNNSALFDYSGDKRVLPVSPTTFYAYLKAILMSFEGQKIEDRAKQILSTIKAIQKDYIQVKESLGVLGRHLNNASSQFNNVTDGFGKLGQKLDSTKTLEKQVIKEIKE